MPLCSENGMNHVFIDDKLRIAVTNTCNLSCFYCHNEGQSHFDAPRFLPPAFVGNMAEWIRKNGVYVESVNLTGGEPLLHPQLLEIIDLVSRITDDIRINTNGVLLTREMIDTLKQHRVTALKIGVDSLQKPMTKPASFPESPSGQMDSTASFEDAVQYALDKMKVVLNVVVTAYNMLEVPQIVATACQLGVKRIKILQLHDMNSRCLNERPGMPEEFKTNQSHADIYFHYFRHYMALSEHIDEHPEKGRTDMFFSRRTLAPESRDESPFEIRFCADICRMNACQVMFTEITADGRLMVCPKYHLTRSVSFDGAGDDPARAIRRSASEKCSNKKRDMSERFRALSNHALRETSLTSELDAGAFIRSSCPAKIDPERQRLLLSHGCRYALDLRRQEEVDEQRSPYETAGVLTYCHLPLTPVPYAVKSERAGRGRECFEKLAAYPEYARKVFAFLAHADGKVIFHCAGGKSRCGVVAAVLLLLGGETEQAVAEDYCTAYFDLYGLERYREKAEDGRRDMLEFIACVKEAYGSARGLLQCIGLTEMEILMLEKKMANRAQ